jgi:hypothetical protein
MQAEALIAAEHAAALESENRRIAEETRREAALYVPSADVCAFDPRWVELYNATARDHPDAP